MTDLSLNLTLKYKNIFELTKHALKLYREHFKFFARTMAFPALGVGGALLLIFVAAMIVSTFLAPIATKSVAGYFAILILAIAPGLYLFFKAFWEYLVLMVSLNNMTVELIKNGEVENVQKLHNNVTVRTKDYIIFLLLLSVIPFIPMFLAGFLSKVVPFISFVLLVLAVMVMIAIVLSYQAFAFEKLSPLDTIKKSYEVVKKAGFLNALALVIINGIIVGIISAVVSAIVALPVGFLAGIIELLVPSAINLPARAGEAVGFGASIFFHPLISIFYTMFFLANRKKPINKEIIASHDV